jgi:HSP20 family protein
MLNNLFSKNNRQEIVEENDSSAIGDWFEENNNKGDLAVDLYQTEEDVIVKTAIAGVKPENLKISLHNDLLTIKGFRQEESDWSKREYLYQECLWNSFSRSLIIPHEVDSEKIEANLENGVLTITLHKINRSNVQVTIK